MSLVVPIVAGVAAGGGITLAVAQILPKPPPELRSAVARLNSPLQATGALSAAREQTIEGGSGIIPESLVRWLGGSGMVRTTPQDLALLGRSADRHAAEKISMAILGLLMVPVFAALAGVAHVHIPIAIPAGGSLLVGALMFFGPDLDAMNRAKKARTDFDKILHAYLVNVALERRANRGIVQALEEAASVGDSWVLRRIRMTLSAAQMANVTPWQALEELGTEIGVNHLVEAAQTMRSASEEGTAVFARLIAQANSLGDAVLAEERAIANSRSERMIVPVSAMGIVIMATIAYPMVQALSNAR